MIATTEIGPGLRAVRSTPGVGGCRALEAAVAILRRSSAVPFAFQLIQEQMEQFRRAARREITCKYPPTEDDPSSVVSMSSPTMAVSLVEAVQPTEFLYDAIEPGLAHAWLVRGPQSALPEISHRLFGNARHSVPGDPLLVGD